MRFDYSVDVCGAAAADFDNKAIEFFLSLCEGGKCLSMSLRNDLARLDDTFLLKGGLDHIMLRLRLF